MRLHSEKKTFPSKITKKSTLVLVISCSSNCWRNVGRRKADVSWVGWQFCQLFYTVLSLFLTVVISFLDSWLTVLSVVSLSLFYKLHPPAPPAAASFTAAGPTAANSNFFPTTSSGRVVWAAAMDGISEECHRYNSHSQGSVAEEVFTKVNGIGDCD